MQSKNVRLHNCENIIELTVGNLLKHPKCDAEHANIKKLENYTRILELILEKMRKIMDMPKDNITYVEYSESLKQWNLLVKKSTNDIEETVNHINSMMTNNSICDNILFDCAEKLLDITKNILLCINCTEFIYNDYKKYINTESITQTIKNDEILDYEYVLLKLLNFMNDENGIIMEIKNNMVNINMDEKKIDIGIVEENNEIIMDTQKEDIIIFGNLDYTKLCYTKKCFLIIFLVFCIIMFFITVGIIVNSIKIM